MRSAIVRRVCMIVLSAMALGGGVPLASHVLYVVAAHAELDRLNSRCGTSATLDDDPLNPLRRARSDRLFRLIREASETAAAADYATPTTTE